MTPELNPGEHFMVATQGMRGFFACEYWINNRDLDTPFPEPWESDFMTFDTYEEACARARQLAEELELPYVP